MLLPLTAWAQGSASGGGSSSANATVDAITMLENLSKTYPAFIALASAFCYVFGFLLAIRGIYYLKVYGELRTMMTTQSSLKTPITYFLAAAALSFIPSAYHIFLFTAFHTTNPLAYDQVASTIDPRILKAIVGLVQLIGFFAFIRGWMILVAIAQQSSGQHTFGKAITHIIGGIFAMNVLGLSQMLWTTFGFNFNI